MLQFDGCAVCRRRLCSVPPELLLPVHFPGWFITVKKSFGRWFCKIQVFNWQLAGRNSQLLLHCFAWRLAPWRKFEILGICKIHKYIQPAANKTAAWSRSRRRGVGGLAYKPAVWRGRRRQTDHQPHGIHPCCSPLLNMFLDQQFTTCYMQARHNHDGPGEPVPPQFWKRVNWTPLHSVITNRYVISGSS